MTGWKARATMTFVCWLRDVGPGEVILGLRVQVRVVHAYDMGLMSAITSSRGLLSTRACMLILAGAGLVLAVYAAGVTAGYFPMSNAVPLGLAWCSGAFACLFLYRLRPLYLLLGACAAGALLVECGAYLLPFVTGQQLQLFTEHSTVDYMRSDPTLGFALVPETRPRVSRELADGTVIYRDVPYTIDAMGRRVTEAPCDEASRHALFFGGSHVFGYGLPDAATLPSAFQAATGGVYRAYNYAVSGYGTGQMLLQLRADDLMADVSPERGVAVYAFIYDHLNRSTPYILNRVQQFGPNGRYFDLSNNGALKGPYVAAEWAPLRTAMDRFELGVALSPTFRVLARSPLIHMASEEEAFAIATAIITASREAYEARFEGEFVVIIWPRQEDRRPGYKRFVAALRARGIPVVDVPEFRSDSPATLHPRDEHPSAAEAKWVGQCLARFLVGRDQN